MRSRVILKILIFLAASVFAYSLLIVGMRDADNVKLLGCGLSLILALSVILSLFFEFNHHQPQADHIDTDNAITKQYHHLSFYNCVVLIPIGAAVRRFFN